VSLILGAIDPRTTPPRPPCPARSPRPRSRSESPAPCPSHMPALRSRPARRALRPCDHLVRSGSAKVGPKWVIPEKDAGSRRPTQTLGNFRIPLGSLPNLNSHDDFRNRGPNRGPIFCDPIGLRLCWARAWARGRAG
jgi:hypothetical protein